jgi:hypothetical protein
LKEEEQIMITRSLLKAEIDKVKELQRKHGKKRLKSELSKLIQARFNVFHGKESFI